VRRAVARQKKIEALRHLEHSSRGHPTQKVELEGRRAGSPELLPYKIVGGHPGIKKRPLNLSFKHQKSVEAGFEVISRRGRTRWAKPEGETSSQKDLSKKETREDSTTPTEVFLLRDEGGKKL